MKLIEDTKVRQNQEMLAVLEEEQAAENEREDMISKVDDQQERKRLEKIFGMERAKAQARI